ncbi:hypothetical protein DFH08DRAFT_817881 [Mycena albidolilacea]|uniref:Uncharacterized protein n=1 Tax=Mycena albidolilacea TaxID=1033008 RepID=A0AAD6ZHV9_9AGAR|nr:hypothetical protein DFH08DRAFT_817881 [Mycena albidolilacea]
MDAVEVQDVKVALQVWGGCSGRKCHHAPQPAAESPTRPRPDLAGSKHDKSSSKGAPKPAPKAPKAPKPKTASRRKHEHSVPPVELAAAMESEDEDDTEAQEDDEPDELGEADKECGERTKSVPEDEERDKSPSRARSSLSSPPNSLWRRTVPVVHKACLSRPCRLLSRPLPPKKPVGGGGEESFPVSQSTHGGGAPQWFARPAARPAPADFRPAPASQEVSGGGGEESCAASQGPLPVPPLPPKKPVEGEKSPTPPPQMPVEEERATGLPDPPPVPPPPPKKPVKEGEESSTPPPKAPAEEPVPPPPPKKIAEEDGADDSDEDPLDLENDSDDDDVGAAEPDRGKAAAIANTLQLRRKQRKDARGAVAKALEAWLADAAAKAAELSTAHGVPLEDVKAMMGSSGKLKKKRGYDEFKAKVWRRTAELNEGQGNHQDEPADAWTEDELKALKADFIAFDEQRESGKCVTKRAAAQDVTFTCDKIFEEMQSLEQRTGARSFFVIAGASVNDTITPGLYCNSATGQFVPDILKMPTTALPLTFQRWASLDKAVKPKGQNKRAQVAEMIRSGLNEMFGTTTVPVEYKNVREKIEAGMGVRFFGWVENMPWVTTSNLGTGGADTINTMWDRLKAGTAGWCDIAEDEHHRLLQEFPGQEKNYKMWKSKRDAVKAREAEEGDEDKPVAAGPSKIARGSRKRKSKEMVDMTDEEVVEGMDAVEAPAKKKARKAVDAVEGEVVDVVEEQPKKKAKAKKVSEGGEKGNAKGKVKAKAKGKAKAKETEKEKEKEVVEKTTTDGKRKRKRKAALDNDEESEDSKSKKVKRAPFRHLTSSTPPPRPQPKPAFKNVGQGKTIVPVDVIDPAPPTHERTPTPDLDDPALSYQNKQWYIRCRKTEQHAREERARLGSVEYEARQARKAAKWMAAANTGTAGPSKPPKPSKTLTEVEGEDSDEFNGGSGSGSDSESE